MTGHLNEVDTARQLRDVGIERSSRSAGTEWFNEATEHLVQFLKVNDTLHVDALWDSGLPETKATKRCLGAVIRNAVTSNWIEPIIDENGYLAALPSKRNRMCLKQVWRSNLFVESSDETDDWYDRLP